MNIVSQGIPLMTGLGITYNSYFFIGSVFLWRSDFAEKP